MDKTYNATSQEQEDNKTGIRVINSYLSDDDYKVQWGLNLRNAMNKKIKLGSFPTGYRPDWLRKTALKMHELVKKSIKEFESTYTWDKINKLDVYDLLKTYETIIETEL